MPPHDQNGCTVLFTSHQSAVKMYQTFSIFQLAVWISAYKVGVAKNMQGVLRKWMPLEKMLKIQIS